MLTQTLQSMRVVKAYGQEANEAQRFRQIVAQHPQVPDEDDAQRAPQSGRSGR